MDTHVKVLGVLHVALGAIGVVLAACLIVIFTGTAGIVGASSDPDAAVAIPILGITGSALVILTLALSLPGILVGIGLFRFRPWARIGGIVLSIFDLIWVPFGTIVGVYGLWVLFSKETERLFTPVAPAPPVA